MAATKYYYCYACEIQFRHLYENDSEPLCTTCGSGAIEEMTNTVGIEDVPEPEPAPVYVNPPFLRRRSQRSSEASPNRPETNRPNISSTNQRDMLNRLLNLGENEGYTIHEASPIRGLNIQRISRVQPSNSNNDTNNTSNNNTNTSNNGNENSNPENTTNPEQRQHRHNHLITLTMDPTQTNPAHILQEVMTQMRGVLPTGAQISFGGSVEQTSGNGVRQNIPFGRNAAGGLE